jgi:hypothetical protein
VRRGDVSGRRRFRGVGREIHEVPELAAYDEVRGGGCRSAAKAKRLGEDLLLARDGPVMSTRLVNLGGRAREINLVGVRSGACTCLAKYRVGSTERTGMGFNRVDVGVGALTGRGSA